MCRDLQQGDEVFWIPTNDRTHRVRIVQEVDCPFAGIHSPVSRPTAGGSEIWPGIADVERCFLIELLPPETGRETVPMSQLRRLE
jgi:hypothetical protein